MTQGQIIQAIKSSWVLGAIASVTVILFGGWSGTVIGWLLGTGAGLVACQGKRIPTPKIGAIIGASAGLILGIWLFVASILEGFAIRLLSGQSSRSIVEILQFGIGALLITTIAATVIAALQALPNPRKQQATLVTLAFILIIFPFVDQVARTSWIATTIEILIYIILALGLNITVGFAGLLDLGYAAFFAIGAYTTGLLSSSQLGIEWNFWVVLPIAAVVAALAGVILGAPTLRLRGDYLAIVTLGFGEIVPVVFRNLTEVRVDEPISKLFGTIFGHPEWGICLLGCTKPFNLTNGEAGINPIGRPSLPFVGTFESSNYLPWYYLILILVVFSYFMIDRLRNSRLGRSWAAIREDELAASAMGINLVKTKLLAFSMGATFSGFGGAFYAAYISAIFPTVFDFSVSVIILCMVILGGLGNMTGVILGGIIIMSADRLYLPQLAKVLKDFLSTSVLPNVANPQLKDFIATSLDPIQMRLLLFGLTLVIMMIVRPEGLVPDAMHQAELRESGGNENESLADARSQ